MPLYEEPLELSALTFEAIWRRSSWNQLLSAKKIISSFKIYRNTGFENGKN